MKKLFFALFALLSLSTYSQTLPITNTGAQNKGIKFLGYVIGDQGMYLPVNNSSAPSFGNLANKGLIRVNSSTNKLQFHDGTSWIDVVGGGVVTSVVGETGDVTAEQIAAALDLLGYNYWTKTGNDIANNNTGFVDIVLQDLKFFRIKNDLGEVKAYINENGLHSGSGYQCDFNGGLTDGGSSIQFLLKNPGGDVSNRYFETSRRIDEKTDQSSHYTDLSHPNLGYIKSSLVPARSFTYKVQYPSEFTFRPFDILYSQGKFYPSISNKDVVKDKIARMTPYYVDYTNGSNSNNGLTRTTAFKTVPYALTQGARLIYLRGGDRIGIDGFGVNTITSLAADVFIIAEGSKPAYIFNDLQGLSFSLYSGSTYSVDISSNTVPNIVDMNFVDSYGYPLSLRKQTSIANVEANAGSYYITGTTLYVHLTDGRAPDTNVYVLKISSANRITSTGTAIFYAENLYFMGGTQAFETQGSTSGASGFYSLLNNCRFSYAQENGYRNNQNPGWSWVENSVAYNNGRDGFNYAQGTNYTTTKSIEVNCYGFENGVNTSDLTSALNGSSMHNNGTILRVGGKYYRNVGPNIIDVSGAKSFNVGVEAFESLGFDDTPINPTSPGVNWANWGDFAVGTIATEAAAKMWCYGCVSKDNRLSFDTPQFLSDNVTPDPSILYVDQSTYLSPYDGSVTFGTFTFENVASTSLPPVSSFTPKSLLSGDVTANEYGVSTLATVNSNVGSFGSATQSPVITVNGKGLITAVSAATITPAVGSITGLGTGVSTWLATPSSANLASALTDETGNGASVFATSPTLVTPVLGDASATSLTLASSAGLVITGGSANNYVSGTGAHTNFGTSTRAASLAGLPAGSNTAITGASNVINAFANLQAQINFRTVLVPSPITATTYSLPTTNQIVFVTFTGSSPSTWTLPTIANASGITWVISNQGTATVTVNSNAGANDIYASGASTNTISILATQDMTIRGGNPKILAQ